ncbi:MAG: hypothetical protein EPN36_07350 [Rhodanobacteraceae bacterium]|nr:MAG: hypothetical protein EPN36_07350 [Rhodanobacteraceae bacterium]
MEKYRKKPVEIEAVQFVSGTDPCIPGVRYYPRVGIGVECCYMDTPEGKMRATPGDWIIRGVKGELYPCSPEVFAITYEAVEG